MTSTPVQRTLWATTWAAFGALLPAPGAVSGQEAGDADVRIERTAVTLSSGAGGRAELELELADGSEHAIEFSDGTISLDGDRLGTYEADGVLVEAWRAFLRDYGGAEASALQQGLVELVETLEGLGEELGGTESESSRALGGGLADVLGLAPAREAEPPAGVAGAGGASLSIAPGGVQFEELVGQLQRLREALGRLGGVADGAARRLALIVHDDYAISRDDVVEGNLALLEGTLRLDGRVSGDVLVLDGTLVLADGARIDGNVLQVGGEVEIAESAGVTGEILSDFPSAAAPAAAAGPSTDAAEAPVAATRARERRASRDRGFFDRVGRNLEHATEEFMSALGALIILGVLGLLLVYFANARLETVADTVRHEFARSFAMGLAGEVLFFPALLILAVLVITWPIVPFFVLATGLAMVVGYLAVAHGAGEMFAQRRYRYEWLERLRRSNSYYYVLSGLVLLLLPFAASAILWVGGGTVDFFRGLLAFVACVGTWILVTAGFGAVLLTRAGSRSVVVDWRADATATHPVADTEFDMGAPGDTTGSATRTRGPAAGGGGSTTEATETDDDASGDEDAPHA